jgi:hypothetical protein
MPSKSHETIPLKIICGVKEKVVSDEEPNPTSEPPKKFKLKSNKVNIIL